MSNLIKYPFVNLKEKDAVVIRNEKETDRFVPLEENHKIKVVPAEEVERQEAARREMAASASERGIESFSAGIPVVNVDDVLLQKKEEADQMAEVILSEAREQAEMLVRDAESQADSIREKARQEGISAGKEEGIAEAQQEIACMRQKWEEEVRQHENEYQELIAQAEPRYVEVLCSLIRKITGVIAENQKDLLLHLIRSSIADMDPAKKYILRVSPEDVLYLEGHKDKIREQAGLTASIEVQEEKGLAKNECIIESDTQMVDCGFQTQLANLVSTLRMLA